MRVDRFDDTRGTGIRYYAYAFDRAMTEQALRDPRRFISGDPLADAWGFEPGAMDAITNFEQSVAKRDMLYLDKAWSLLQQLTEPGALDDEPRPAFRMFEGRVADREWGWDAWVRAVTPDEVVAIAHDLARIHDADARPRFRELSYHGRDAEAEADYGMQYLRAARTFVAGLAADDRGMAYLIG